jgi:hypothetical protein
MAKKGPNHQHHRDDPPKNTTAPTKAGDDKAPGRSGQATQDRDEHAGKGQFGGAGDPPLMKK